MSFQDLEAGGLRRQHLFDSKQKQPQQQLQDPSHAVAAAIFRINTAVSSFYRLVNSLGTPKDTLELRDKLSVFFSHFNSLSFSVSLPGFLFYTKNCGISTRVLFFLEI